MRNISFSMTAEAILEQRKTVTRRMGWRFLKVGDKIRPAYKAQGLARGERVKQIEVVSIRREPLSKIDAADVCREGFPMTTRAEFMALFCKANSCEQDDEVARIEFRYVEDPTELVLTDHMQDDHGSAQA